jgi:hypothetical protein
MEKYKKKLQEGADLRQHVKVIQSYTYISTQKLKLGSVIRETKRRSCRQKCVAGRRIPKSGGLQALDGVVQKSNR